MFNFVYADQEGKIYDHPKYLALGRLGNNIVEPDISEFIPLPEGASLILIPERTAIISDRAGRFRKFKGGQPVGALLPQGYTRTLLPAFVNDQRAGELPLFGYAAVAYQNNRFYVAAKQTDLDENWNPKHFNTGDLEKRVKFLLNKFPTNSIVKQLAHCALHYSCFTAQNVFYHRWEGGIPVSPVCNAQCLGCISLQPSECCPSPQARIKKAPEVKEIVELGSYHLNAGSDSIISFGQGCEGEPSLEGEIISRAIIQIREKTARGIINMNTNAGYTKGIQQVVDAGIDSLRVSLNSGNQAMYQAYYRPRNFTLQDVKKSLYLAAEAGTYTSLNLLFFPGINDTEGELEDLISLVRETVVKAIQIRNLNIDPDYFLKRMPKPRGEALGVPAFLEIIAEELPAVEIGNYTKARTF